MESKQNKEIAAKKNEKVFFYDKKSLLGPLSDYSKNILEMAENDPGSPGVVLPNGQINWGCPCLGTASIGPCSTQFRAAFSCFHYSEAEIKGSDCLGEFEKLQDCMRKFPKLYAKESSSNEIKEESFTNKTNNDNDK